MVAENVEMNELQQKSKWFLLICCNKLSVVMHSASGQSNF